jgi:hypothetical protein
MLFSKKGDWGKISDEDAYIKEYGEEQFFKDLIAYGELMGKEWGDILDKEQISVVALHKKALLTINRYNQAV